MSFSAENITLQHNKHTNHPANATPIFNRTQYFLYIRHKSNYWKLIRSCLNVLRQLGEAKIT